jgi:DNA-binding NtrC family response regulator
LFFFLFWSQCVPFLKAVERKMITEALARSGGVQTRAAEMLGISERALRYKLHKYGWYEDPNSE